MSHFNNERGVYLGPAQTHGAHQLREVIWEAITVARSENCVVVFTFNWVTVFVEGLSSVDLIYRDCVRALGGYNAANVGPYPNEILSEEELANDARIEARTRNFSYNSR